MTDCKLERVDSEISIVREVIEKERAKLSKLIDKRERIFMEQNESNYRSIEWLVSNPNTPGHFEAMRKWMIAEFGGDYMGVTASGYYPKINQQAFGFMVTDWDGEVDDSYIDNIKKFSDKVLPLLKPSDGGYVSFTYATGEFSGIFSIDYCPKDKSWSTSNTVYGRTRDREQHNSLDDAIMFAIEKSRQIDD